MEKTGTLSQKKRVTRKTGVENNVTQENTNKAGHDRKRAISHSERYKMIADAAYFRAQSRGFSNDVHPVADWLAAEAEIDAVLTDLAANLPLAE